ncbi:response regulator transcription factor [Dyella terrae]|uniref:Response regulator transcription factor n=2 Tax=Dyella TaxID=231454 RepID=A0A4R0YZN4_9GAMM|nr:response regulator transcription factor [Dyella soli]TBR39515.1 response regulator transcription factor [Dyella terrae]TCI12899.1 response regulator transcription factor [Dyella soli]
MHTDSAAATLPAGKAAPRVVIADDHRIVAEGIEHILAEDYELLAVVSDGYALIDTVRRLEPDVVIADINMPGCSGLDALKQLRSENNRTPFILLTMHAEPALASSAMRSGASGYVLKMSAGEDLIDAIQQVLAGSTYVTPSLGARFLCSNARDIQNLTTKQCAVLRLVGKGLRSKQIAAELGLSVRTVEAHKYTMMQMFGVHSTLEMVRKAEELGVLHC